MMQDADIIGFQQRFLFLLCVMLVFVVNSHFFLTKRVTHTQRHLAHIMFLQVLVQKVDVFVCLCTKQ